MCVGVPVIFFLCLFIFFPPQHVSLGRNGFLISISYRITSEKMHQHFSIACAGSTNWGFFALSKKQDYIKLDSGVACYGGL